MLNDQTAWRRPVAAVLMYVFSAQQSWARMEEVPIVYFDPVLITGTYEGTNYGDLSNSMVNVPGGAPQDPGNGGSGSGAAEAGSGGGMDTRVLCGLPSKKQLAATTSRDGEVARQDAARALVGMSNWIWSVKMIWGRLAGQLTMVEGKYRMKATVTFADGGSESYYINPFLTDSAEPIAGTLKTGDGVPKNVPCKP